MMDGRKLVHSMGQLSTEPVVLAPAETSLTGQRLVSLDAFRGATMALMVLVNTPGDGEHVYGPLRHAEWNGWTPTDVVFPCFMWIVGVALTLSLSRRIAAGASRAQLLAQAFRRALILYALGLLVYAFPDFNLSRQRLLGVLQRIAICYLIAVAIYLYTGVRGQIVWIISLLAGYWLLMALVPVPGYGAGRLDVEGNLAHYIDRIVLGAHNYASTKTWDPEGIVSTLPAIATVLFGIMAGHILRLERTLARRTVWLLAVGGVLVAAGLICNMRLPINKKLWTSSFALFMAGLDFVIFAVMVWWVDIRGHARFVKPLVIMGMNAITVYLVSELLEELLNAVHFSSVGHTVTVRDWLFDTLFAPLASPINASLLYAIAYTLLMYGIAYVMYRRRWFVRV
jgi:predicted acyltransferase